MTILTPEQEALIPVYQEKWKAIALSTEPINIPRAEAAIKNAYAIMGRKAPRVCFRNSPDAAITLALKAEKNPVTSKMKLSFNQELRRIQQQRYQLEINERNPWEILSSGLRDSACYQLEGIGNYERVSQITSVNWMKGVEVGFQSYLQKLVQQLKESSSPRGYYCYCFSPIEGAVISILLDFCSSVLHLPVEERKWEAFASVVKECGWIFCTDEICVVCVRVACRRRIALAFFPWTAKTVSTLKENLPLSLPMVTVYTHITAFFLPKNIPQLTRRSFRYRVKC